MSSWENFLNLAWVEIQVQPLLRFRGTHFIFEGVLVSNHDKELFVAIVAKNWVMAY